MVLAIVALFACTQVSAKQPRIIPQARVIPHVFSDVVLTFLSADGKKHEARIERDVLDPDGWKVRLFVEDKEITVDFKSKELDKFSICEQDVKGTVTIDEKKYFCHVLQAVSEGALLIGNDVCLVEIAPGIIINL